MDDVLLKELLVQVVEKTGHDFREYRDGTIKRRIARRMALLEAKTLEDYIAILRREPSECDNLVKELTIKVSHFFRNPYVFEVIDQAVWPELIEATKSGRHLRIWSAACARGEETYSLAMSVLDHMERKKTPGNDHNTTIIGTDIDQDALAAARQGRYDLNSLGEVKKRLFDKYFQYTDNFYNVVADIKQMVTFSVHDLTSQTIISPPAGVVTNYDLILCRNILIYFTAHLQERVLYRLWKGLNRRAYLVLGESEALFPGMSKYFESFDRRGNIYRKIGD